MSHPEPTYCLTSPLVQSIAEASTRRLRLVNDPCPADFDHLAGSVSKALNQAVAAGPVDEWDVEPDEAELAAIEAEWPVLAAELAVVDAHCRFLACPDVSTRRALRRAESARDRTVANHTTTTSRSEGPRP